MNGKALKIFLICLILTLSILDAPEYIHCVHLGLCEFLELNAHFPNITRSDIKEHHPRTVKNNFFSFLENLVNNNELIKKLILFYLPFIITFLKLSCILMKKKTLYLRNIGLPSFLVENKISSHSLKILEISVIRS